MLVSYLSKQCYQSIYKNLILLLGSDIRKLITIVIKIKIIYRVGLTDYLSSNAFSKLKKLSSILVSHVIIFSPVIILQKCWNFSVKYFHWTAFLASWETEISSIWTGHGQACYMHNIQWLSRWGNKGRKKQVIFFPLLSHIKTFAYTIQLQIKKCYLIFSLTSFTNSVAWIQVHKISYTTIWLYTLRINNKFLIRLKLFSHLLICCP